jgi:protein-disulfide isomerase
MDQPTRKLARLVFIPAAAALVALALGIGIGSRFLAGNDAELTSEEFDRRVRDSLLRNPDVLMEAARSLDQPGAPAPAASGAVATLVRDNADAIFRDPGSPVGGNPDGDVAIVEFFDYNCPYCRSMAPVLSQALDADGKIRFVYKEWPILGPGSEFAARAALAAHKQGKYEAFHDALMNSTEPATEARVLDVARANGLDIERLERDMAGDDILQALARNMETARTLGITGTPTYVIGDEIVRGAVGLRILQASIAQARNASTGLP